jgi:hypothetical protein
MTQNGLLIAWHFQHISLSCESSCRGCIRYSLRMGFKTLSFFCPVLSGLFFFCGPAVLPCVAQTGMVSPVGGDSDQAPRYHPWGFLRRLSISLSLSQVSLTRRRLFGLWSSETWVFGGCAFPPVTVSLGPAGDCPFRDSESESFVRVRGLWSLEDSLSSRSLDFFSLGPGAGALGPSIVSAEYE